MKKYTTHLALLLSMTSAIAATPECKLINKETSKQKTSQISAIIHKQLKQKGLFRDDDGKYYLNEKENIVDSFHHYKDWYIVYTSLDGGNLIYKGAPSLDNSFIDTTGGAYGPEDTKKSIYKQLKRGKTKDIPDELAKCYASIYGN